jgi:hypothetical protein
MSWVGLRDNATTLYNPAGLGKANPAAVDLNGLLPKGTLLVQCDVKPGTKGHDFLDYRGESPWITGLSLTLNAQGLLMLTQTQGAFRRVFTLPTGLGAHSASLLVRFSWDAPARAAVFSVEIIETGKIISAVMQAPLPLSLRDAVRISTDPEQCEMSKQVTFLAIADSLMPHGPLPSLSGQTQLPTPDGGKPLAQMKAGQLVTTSDGGTAQIRWVGQTTLPARGHFAPQRLRAPYHGATRDLIAAPGQRIHMSGSEVEYLFATDAVSVAVGQLREGVQTLETLTQTYYQLLLDRPTTVTVGDVALECLDCMPLIKRPDLRRHSVLADLPAELLPQQPATHAPLLQDYETLTLCRLRAA